MADKPALFSGSMVRALLREIAEPSTGKTQTRRVTKHQDSSRICSNGNGLWLYPGKLPYSVGDRIWVREAWRVSRIHDETPPRDLKPRTMTVFFEAGGSIANQDAPGDWKAAVWPEVGERPEWAGKPRPSMFMPRWASRITLEVTGVKVERLQDCSREDAIAEGLIRHPFAPVASVSFGCNWTFEEDSRFGSPVSAYASLWDHINGPGAWDKNPWVAAYTFRPILGNIDQLTEAA